MDDETKDLIARMSKELRGLGQAVNNHQSQELPDDWPVHVGNPRVSRLRGFLALANEADAALARSASAESASNP